MRSHLMHSFTALLAACGLLLVHTGAAAEDIDIFVGSPANEDLPNVLIVLDNSANWSSSVSIADCYYSQRVAGTGELQPTTEGPKGTNPGKEQGTKMALEKCALHDTIEMLPVAADGGALFNVGLMLFNESPAANSGGYPRVAIKPLTQANKDALKQAIKDLKIGDDKGNNAAFSKALYEAYLYLKAKEPYKGTATGKYDPAAFSSGRYNPPGLNACGKNFVIFLANGSAGEVTDNEARALLTGAGGSATRFTYPTSYISNSDQANWADEFTNFMATRVPPIKTYTIAVTGSSSDNQFPNFLNAMAAKGGTTSGFTANNVAELMEAMKNIFAQIQSVSSVFASATLPVSVNTRGTYLNQVFMGMFVPDGRAGPRWYGNLKQYQFEYNQTNDSLSLVDSAGEPAISATTGFIAPTAESFWSHDSSFWTNDPMGTPATVSDSPDGEVVPKGAAAQVLRDTLATSQASRQVYTCLSCSSDTVLGSSTATQFKVGNNGITAAALGVSAADVNPLIEWVRGTDNASDESGPGGSITVRPSVLGDVLHSRPAAVNYGGNVGVVVYYGANDGMLHAINGNKSETMVIGSSSYAPGGTLWSFVPEEMLPKLKRLRSNSPMIAYPHIPVTPDAKRRDYFVDGPISMYQKYAADGSVDKIYMYVGMRRGGRFLYAFDVTVPNAPKFLWKVSNADIAKLGQTWSEASITRVRGHANPVIVMGGGYDAEAEDADPALSTTMGNVVLVLDAFTGALVKSFDTERSVPADVSIIDADFDGFADRAYAVDLGGNVYRLDFEVGVAYQPADWQINTLAEVGDSGGTKLFFAPDVVLTRNYAAVMVGSGDREKPLKDDTTDYFFTFIDKNLKGVVPSEAIGFDDLPANTEFTSAAQDKGCYYALREGEKVVNAALTIGGNTYFGTNVPQRTDDSCSVRLGVARSYELPLICKTKTSVVLNGGGLPPSPVAGVVTVPYVNRDGTVTDRQVPFIIGSGGLASALAPDNPTDPDPNNENQELSGGSPLDAEKVKPLANPRRKRLYWFNESSH